MPKRELKAAPRRQTRKQQAFEFVEPVVLTPVQVLPDVARDVAARTRELVKQLMDSSSSTRLRSNPVTRSQSVVGSRPR